MILHLQRLFPGGSAAVFSSRKAPSPPKRSIPNSEMLISVVRYNKFTIAEREFPYIFLLFVCLQHYYESLSSKARPKTRSPRSAPIEELSQRLESKLNAAEQKRYKKRDYFFYLMSRILLNIINNASFRLSILEKDLARLAKLDEARQAAKNGLVQRVEKQRDELETKVEEKVQKAEKNRMLLFKAMAQRRAAKRQRAAQSLMQRAILDNRYKESVRAAIYQKRAAAESKRMGILEAERRRANTRLRQVFGAASSVQSQKEAERRKMKDRLEERLQRVYA